MRRMIIDTNFQLNKKKLGSTNEQFVPFIDSHKIHSFREGHIYWICDIGGRKKDLQSTEFTYGLG